MFSTRDVHLAFPHFHQVSRECATHASPNNHYSTEKWATRVELANPFQLSYNIYYGPPRPGIPCIVVESYMHT